jgi:hypothetical protein
MRHVCLSNSVFVCVYFCGISYLPWHRHHVPSRFYVKFKGRGNRCKVTFPRSQMTFVSLKNTPFWAMDFRKNLKLNNGMHWFLKIIIGQKIIFEKNTFRRSDSDLYSRDPHICERCFLDTHQNVKSVFYVHVHYWTPQELRSTSLKLQHILQRGIQPNIYMFACFLSEKVARFFHFHDDLSMTCHTTPICQYVIGVNHAWPNSLMGQQQFLSGLCNNNWTFRILDSKRDKRHVVKPAWRELPLILRQGLAGRRSTRAAR